MRVWIVLLFGVGCCVPAAERAERDAGRAPLVEAEVGTQVWAPFESGRWMFHATIVEVDAGATEALVVYADGDLRSLPIASFRPDGVDYGTRVSARYAPNGPWSEAIVQRRIGLAVFVRSEVDYEERWISLAWLRVSAERASMMTSPAQIEETPTVIGNWQGRGEWFPAVVAGRRDGLVHLVYADGGEEWAAPSAMRPHTFAPGDHVEARLTSESGTFAPVEIRKVLGYALRVTDPEGRAHFTSLARVRVP